VISAEITDGGYTLLDTGGIGYKGKDTPAALTKASEEQVDFAIATAGLILFVIDGLEGLTALDERIAAMLRRSKKPVRLVINKADFGDEKIDLAEAYRLGLGEPLRVSAEHGRGELELRDAIMEVLGVPDDSSSIRDPALALGVCFIGRPNVGKSSLSNRLLQSDRLIVSEVPGTTRDAVELPFEFKGRNGKLYPFRLIDTAGIKAATKLASPIEYFSRLRSLDAIKNTDVVFLVLDAMDGVTQQDKAIAGEAVKEHKPIVIVVNKWDLVKEAFKRQGGFEPYKSERDYREKYEAALFERLYFTPGSPVIFVSAMTGYEVDRMLNAAVKLNRQQDLKLPTAKLNQVLGYLTERTPPPAVGGKRFRIYYATQTGTRPFRIKLFCNREEKLTEQYRRYLEAGLVKEFDLAGCPVYFDLVGKEKHEPGTPYSGKAARAEAHTPKWKQSEGSDDDFPHETLED
jgi:GTP-binding protein